MLRLVFCWQAAGKQRLGYKLIHTRTSVARPLINLQQELPAQNFCILAKLVPGMAVLDMVPLLHKDHHQVLQAHASSRIWTLGPQMSSTTPNS